MPRAGRQPLRLLWLPSACQACAQGLLAQHAAEDRVCRPSGRVHGSRRLSAVLRAQSLHIGRQRVRRLMPGYGLRALTPNAHTTDSGHALPVSANVLARRTGEGL